MKRSRVVRGGIIGGLIAAVLLAVIGRALAIAIPPWNALLMPSDYYVRAVRWLVVLGVLAPAGAVLGLLTALVCAIAFEYVMQRAGWWAGAAIGLCIGVAGAALVGLVPWFASWYGYAYTPVVAPLGPNDPSWAFVGLVLAGMVMGAIAGGLYGPPLHRDRARDSVKWRQVYPTLPGSP